MVTVRQQVPLGLGHAIWCARAFIGDDPFAILLPDDLVLADTPCLQQLADVYRDTGGNVVAVTEVPREQTNRYGILRTGKDDGRLVEVLGLVEKPAPKDAPSNLSIIGRYVLMPEVIGHLARMERGAGNEVQLTDGMAKLIGQQPFHGLRYEGQTVRLRRQDRLPGGADRLRPEAPRHGGCGARLPEALRRSDRLHRDARSPARRFTRDVLARFDPTTLREYDIRGIVGRTLSEADAFAIGRCFGTLVARARRPHGRGRLRRPAVEPGAGGGAVERAERQRDRGDPHRPRPDADAVLRHAKLETDGAVMVTGSHNPPDYNGFKMVLGRQAVLRRRRSTSSAAWRAAGDVVAEAAAQRSHASTSPTTTSRACCADWDGGDRMLKVVWDNGNGAAGDVLAEARRRTAR